MQEENSRTPLSNLALVQYSAWFAGVLLVLILSGHFLIQLSHLNESYFLNAAFVFFATYGVSWILMRRETRYLKGSEIWRWGGLCFVWMLAIDAAGFPGTARSVLDTDYPSHGFVVNFLLAAVIMALALVVSLRVTVKAWRR